MRTDLGEFAMVEASLSTSLHYGIVAGMSEMRKITVEVPKEDLVGAQEFTQAGVTETVRAGLRQLRAKNTQHELRKLRGSFKFSVDLDALREDRALHK
jgi:hypothetical protein